MRKQLQSLSFWINKRYELGYDAIQILKIRQRLSAGKFHKLSSYFLKRKYNKLCKRNGAFLRLTTQLGNGISFPHGIAGVFISQGAIIGDQCVIFQQVTIGSNTLSDSAGCGSPKIGHHVYIGAGAKIIGNVRVGDYARIGANAVVTTDVPANATVVMEKPRMILHKESRRNDFVAYPHE